MNYLYLLINILTILFPFLLSFDKKVHFYTHWKALFKAVIIVLIPFVIWDVFFTKTGVWGFNPDYLTGINIINLPIEEWLFFVTVPYACVFIYECMINYFPKLYYDKTLTFVNLTIGGVFLCWGIWNVNQIYTATTFILLGIVLLVIRNITFIRPVYISYLIALVPFFAVNGILTGSFIAEPIVWYNDTENMGIRVFTIPLDDFFYGALLLISNMVLFEKFK